ncbi:RNA-directed DNA polymerase from mobile element jockey-like [Elysia marginata]|uniref:RNA-directed DNA polymerase from mobile element jockey-like n=1 Tax=Elysia marginata TaxID=1093978 RepID=A0AAV4FK00_9GAST|nr:RNA-directed DNA polymerase from mobile element jockey-like [Elysia marginata]
MYLYRYDKASERKDGSFVTHGLCVCLIDYEQVIKDQQGEVLTDGEKIKERWREYYTTLLNKENQRDELEDIPPVEGPIEELTRKEIIDAIKAMKKGKAARCSGVSTDMIKVLEESGVDIMVDIIETVWEEEEMPEDWKQSEIVPIYKQKGDPLDCGNIKLLEYGMKIREKIIEGRLRKTVEIDPMQFGFMPGRGTTDAVFTMQQIQEKNQEKKVELFTTFVDLEKAYDRVPRDLVYWSLRKRKVPEKLIRLAKATTVVRTAHGKTSQFEIEVGLHQGSGLSPFLFTIVLDTISEECRNGLPWELLFADDLAIIADSEEELQRRWLKWQIGLESNGLKVNTGKIEVMISGRNRTKVNIKDKEGRELNQVDQFKYRGVTFSEEGGGVRNSSKSKS